MTQYKIYVNPAKIVLFGGETDPEDASDAAVFAALNQEMMDYQGFEGK
jgi:hypothetical protein